MKFGIFTSSSPAALNASARCQNAIEFLKSQGHEVVVGELFYQTTSPHRAGTIKQRAQDFNWLLSQNCDVYLSAIGGFCANSIIKFIDYKLITPKMTFVGNSDATAVLTSIAQNTKAKVIYGPALISHFGEWEKEYAQASYDQLMQAITKPKNEIKVFDFWTDDYKNWDKFVDPKTKNKNEITFEGKGQLTGNLYPINLSTFSTCYHEGLNQILQENTILFIEDSLKPIDYVERLFSFLALNNLLINVKAVIFGKYEQFDDLKSNIKPHEVFFEVIREFNIDIKFFVYYIDCGHTHPTNSLIFNQKTTIDFDNKKIWQSKK